MRALVALACLRTGIVLDLFGANGQEVEAGQFAAILPELFGASPSADWAAIFERLGAEDGPGFQDIVLLGDDAVHVVQRLVAPAGTALIGVASGTNNVGLVVSLVRKKAAELEAR
ncbi:MAG TPA: hypothetical protein VFQ35_17330 [Polyangiaceae bacterium]|nr:hypothetical protein [Polyangiaceae bacterium]